MKKYLTTKHWVALLRDLPSPEGDFLTVTSLARLTGLKPATLRQACWRNQRAGLLRRVGPNLHANLLKNPQGEHLAVILFPPAYLSLEWALGYHGLTQAATPILTCVTTGRPRRVVTFLGEIAYLHIAERLFFGFERKRTTSGSETFLAYAEKALLDWTYYRQLKGKERLLDEFDFSRIDIVRLREFAQHFPSSVWNELEPAIHEGCTRSSQEVRQTFERRRGKPRRGSVKRKRRIKVS